MSRILTIILLAATTTARITTSLTLPFVFAEFPTWVASIVDVGQDAKTTMALKLAQDTVDRLYSSHYENEEQTITYQGTTSFGEVTITGDAPQGGDYHFSIGCTVGDAEIPTCTMSENGEAVWSRRCAAATSDWGTTTITETIWPMESESAHYTRTGTYTFPSHCLSGPHTLPESEALWTTELEDPFPTYRVVITAGQENLIATITSAPTGATGPKPVETSPTGTGKGSPESTAAAAPLITLAPALVGLGAAVAAFVL